MWAAGATFNLNIITSEKKDFTNTHKLIYEAIQLKTSDPNYFWVAAKIEFLSQSYEQAEDDQLKVQETLGDLYQSKSRFEESEVFYEEAISIWTSPLQLANTHTSPGQLFMSQRHFDKARLQFEKVLALLQESYKQDHPFIQPAISNLTGLDTMIGHNEETYLIV